MDIRILTDGFHKEKQLYTIKKLSLYSHRLNFIRSYTYCQSLRFSPPANEVWGKVIFFHLSVILFTGGGSTWVGTSPADTLPWQVHLHRQVQRPLGRYTTPARYTPGQVHPHPLGRYTPSAKYIPRTGTSPTDGQCAGGTHPTGMHSCLISIRQQNYWKIRFSFVSVCLSVSSQDGFSCYHYP